MIEDLINYYLILFGKVLRKKCWEKTANKISILSFKRINLNKIDGKDNTIIEIVR